MSLEASAIASSTAKTHLKQFYVKTGATSRARAACDGVFGGISAYVKGLHATHLIAGAAGEVGYIATAANSAMHCAARVPPEAAH